MSSQGPPLPWASEGFLPRAQSPRQWVRPDDVRFCGAVPMAGCHSDLWGPVSIELPYDRSGPWIHRDPVPIYGALELPYDRRTSKVHQALLVGKGLFPASYVAEHRRVKQLKFQSSLNNHDHLPTIRDWPDFLQKHVLHWYEPWSLRKH